MSDKRSGQEIRADLIKRFRDDGRNSTNDATKRADAALKRAEQRERRKR
jgi:hypothetical protein